MYIYQEVAIGAKDAEHFRAHASHSQVEIRLAETLHHLSLTGLKRGSDLIHKMTGMAHMQLAILELF